ncbi:MAG: hypothetical protein U0Y10_24405 [Spirosomataceae bacterium]
MLSILQSPEVYQHYRQHLQETNGKIRFWEFLEMHYFSDSNHKKNPNHTHHLPTIDASSVMSLFVHPPFSISLTPKKLSFVEPQSIFSWLNFYKFVSARSLLMPPRY